jgi:hypothetical protein
MTAVATGTSRSLNVRTSAVQSRCNRNRQPRASNAHPYTAVCTRRCGLTMQSESQTSCAPCHSSCTSTCARFGNSQRVSNNNWRRMCTPMLVAPRTTQCRSARTIAVYIHRPNRTTAVRTARACRCTSLCNLRAHSFAQLAQHLTGTSNSACTRTASSWLHTMHRNRARQCHNCSVVL